MWQKSGPAVSDPRGAQRLRAVSRDKVEVEKVWEIERGGQACGGSDAYLDGRLFLLNQVFDAKTGSGQLLDPAPKSKGERIHAGCPSPIVAGGYEYCFGSGGIAWVFDVRGGPVTVLRSAYRNNRVEEEQEWTWRYGWCGNLQHSSCATTSMDRGENRAPLFSDDADREYFSGLVNMSRCSDMWRGIGRLGRRNLRRRSR